MMADRNEWRESRKITLNREWMERVVLAQLGLTEARESTAVEFFDGSSPCGRDLGDDPQQDRIATVTVLGEACKMVSVGPVGA